MLGHLEREAKRRPPKQPRRERIEELAPHVAVGLRRLAEAKARRHELNLCARASEPCRRLMGEGAEPISRRGEGERRVCQAVRLADPAVVANFHATSRYAAEQVLRAAAIADGLALPGEPVLLCGDANLRPAGDGTYAELRSRGFSNPAPGVDQILVRGLPSSAPTVWPEERRSVDGCALSDHTPVELIAG